MADPDEDRQERQQRKTERAIPNLITVADEIEKLNERIFAAHVSFTRDDPADVMVLSFVTKQQEHMRSVRLLVDASQHRDALLICRTMIEGMGRLRWAYNDQPTRTALWMWYGAILDWRQTLKNEEADIPVDPQAKQRLKDLVDQHGSNYYKKSVRDEIQNAEAAGREPVLSDDLWQYDWTSTNARAMFEENGLLWLYDSSYRYSSEWVHWGPRTIFSAMENADWGIGGFSQTDWRAAAESLYLGCSAQIACLQTLDQRFSLGFAGSLDALYDQLTSVFKEVDDIDGLECTPNGGPGAK